MTFLLQIDAPDGGWVAPERVDHLGRASLSRRGRPHPQRIEAKGLEGLYH